MNLTLIAPPWNNLYRPSIQIGTLAAVETAGDPDEVVSEYAYLDWFEFVVTELGHEPTEFASVYDTIGEELYGLGVGDWIFGGTLWDSADPAAPTDGEVYGDFLREHGVAPELIRIIIRLRSAATRFTGTLADRLVAGGTEAFGITTSFSQLIPALAIGKAIKDRAPDRMVCLGGANCDDPMGEAVMRTYPFVDAVVQGEGERAVAAIRIARHASDLVGTPGLAMRTSGEIVSAPALPLPIGETPVPRYDEYFSRLREIKGNEFILPHIALPYQMSRGCWWGEKVQCTFCGENGSTMGYRSKPGEQLVHSLRTLTERYEVLDTYAVDTILAKDDNGIPELARAEVDVTSFFEVKANLAPRALGELRAAGVTTVQPGIESLSTGALKLLKKGATTYHNLRFLVLARELGMDVGWNLLCAMPGETPEMIEEQLKLVPFISHLEPPSTLTKVRVDRYSPYFVSPEEFGIELRGPEKKYRFVHPDPHAEREALAYSFDHEELDPPVDQEAMLALRRRLGARIGLWKKLHDQSGFTFRFGTDLTVVYDHRPHLEQGRTVVRGWRNALFRALVHGGRVNQAVSTAREQSEATEQEVRETLRTWATRGWIYTETGRGLVLAVHDSQRDEYGRALALRGLNDEL